MRRYQRLLEELEHKLSRLESEESDVCTRAEQGIAIARSVIEQMQKLVLREGFENAQAEQVFFKRIKPQAISKLIYYIKLFHIESKRPQRSIKAQRQYLAVQIDKLQTYFNDHREFYHYYRRGAYTLDDRYFQRNTGNAYLQPDTLYFSMDRQFSTGWDAVVATILAHDMLIGYLKKEIQKLSQVFTVSGMPPVLSWTGNKADLVELIYALYCGEVFNHGQVDILEITRGFEAFFDIRLPHVYKVYTEIKTRKGQRTRFLEELIFRFTRKMDQDDA
ncbi:RteC domain-containing protein [Sinomicrobium oceani]|uniref:RteC domain-containing protein n=1 Tax=Sinomicrobium oceani TaxID=1150368 RepID=UPI00227BC48D|nr:RteC domain-containing protein [Sinomicrobium oceani]